VDRAALIARQGHNNLLVLRIQGDKMAVEAKSEVGDVHEAVDVETEGAALDIAFNVKYLADMLKNADAGEIEMRMNGAIAPCTVCAAGGGDVTYMVLPVRTGATQK
jgi:DNA polymerase-3 subunit beta